jgi:hypothetical protein
MRVSQNIYERLCSNLSLFYLVEIDFTIVARLLRWPVCLALLAHLAVTALAELTLQVESPPSVSVALVRFDQDWSYHKGTNAPSASWKTVDDQTLGWPAAPGGFGFSTDNPNETIKCRTVLTDMFNRYSTLYNRQSFQLINAPAADQQLLLTVDFDDAFVAYLDGFEVARFNAPGGPGFEPDSSAVAVGSHESSNGNSDNAPQPPRTFDLGRASRLIPGNHVLAVIGLNRAIDSTDFVLIADLVLTGAGQLVAQDGSYSVVTTNAVVLTGTNNFAGSTRVLVNGVEANFELATGTFRLNQPLQPGMNPLFIAALDTTGHILGTTNKAIISDLGSVSVGGVISTNTTWTGIVRITNDVVVVPGATLTVMDGTVILLSPNGRIIAGTNSTVNLAGSAQNPIYLLPTDRESSWTALAVGSNAVLRVQYVEAVSGQMRADNGGTLLRADAGVPLAPRNLRALVNGTNDLELVWDSPSDNETSFVVERSENGTSWNLLSRTAQNSTNFVDAAAGLGQRYFYRVRSENSEGVSRWSNITAGSRAEPLISVGGVMTRDLEWSPLMGTMLVTESLIVSSNRALTILAGTRVYVTNGVSVVALAGGTIEINGERENPVTISSAAPGGLWRELSAQGEGASLHVRFAEVSGGQTTVYSNAVGLLEDSYFHDYRNPGGTLFTGPLILSSFPQKMTLRRCHLSEYYEILFRDGVVTIEDCLFEYISGDGLDFDGAQSGTVLRRSTFRHGTRAPSNIDAVDVGPGTLGPSRDVLIEDCLIYDFPTDKGVSIGDAPNQATGTIVRNCLIYGCSSGVQVKDGAFAEVYNCTITGNQWGFTNYNKANPSAPSGGGHITNAHNNILWDNNVTIAMGNGGTLTADHCNFGNTNWPGVGNISVDPQFVNPSQRDYRLGPNSPSRGSGRDGADMGALFPVGARMASSHPTFESVQVAGDEVVLRFWADTEKSYRIESAVSLPAANWSLVADIPAPARPKFVEVRNVRPGSARFYRIAGLPNP